MCGIGGIINRSLAKFDKKSFEIIGVLNDQRGGDSSGIFIDGTFAKGLSAEALFSNHTKQIKYPEESFISVVHCRATSPGLKTNLEQCQPVIIQGDEGYLVVLHNGTISNTKELASKYLPNMNVTDLSDTQIMANIFYNYGFDVLLEYKGTATFNIIDYREENPKVYFFSGDSIYNSIKEDYAVERQLYYIKQENRFIFSSLSIPLYLIDDTVEIKRFPTNKLLELVDNDLVIVKEYDRSSLKKDTSKTYIICNNYRSDDDYYYDDNNYYFSSHSSNSLTYDKSQNLYYAGNHIAHGYISFYNSGYISTLNSGDYSLYFWRGRIVPHVRLFKILEQYSKECNDIQIFTALAEHVIDYCCYGPVLDTKIPCYVTDDFRYEDLRTDEPYYTLYPNQKKYVFKLDFTSVSIKEVIKEIESVGRIKLQRLSQINNELKMCLNKFNEEI